MMMMMMKDKTPFQTPHEREDPLLQHPKNVIPSLQSKKDAIDRIEFISLIGIPSTPSFAIHPYPHHQKRRYLLPPCIKKKFTGEPDTVGQFCFDDREISPYSRIPLCQSFGDDFAIKISFLKFFVFLKSFFDKKKDFFVF